MACCALAHAGETYFTGFENFTVGDDTIIGKESWVGTHAGLKLHGVLSESLHGVLGIGNAAVIGGIASTTLTSTSKTVYVRKPANMDPVALGQEVVTFSVLFGITDSGNTTKRDNFEFLVYNSNSPSLQLLAGVQFDNTTMDSSTGKPRRLIYRLSWNGSTYQYVLTGYNFLYDSLETLEFRINYRTNLWTATLSGVPLFQDIPFYTGTNARNFGSVMVKMGVGSSAPVTNYILPGDNYMLFDDYTVRTDPVSTELSVSKTGTGAAKLTWNEEAGYTYQVQYSTDCVTWKSDLASSTRLASLTQTVTYTDPTTPVPGKRFYRIKRVSP
jgi:hypothetical protein